LLVDPNDSDNYIIGSLNNNLLGSKTYATVNGNGGIYMCEFLIPGYDNQ
jgi:hypothetical protein